MNTTERLRRSRTAGVCLLAVLAWTGARADERMQPKQPIPHSSGARPSQTVFGEVVKFTTTPAGRIDGVVLSDGTVVHWPLSLEKRFTSILAKENELEVTGPMVTTPRGDTFLQARTIKNLSNNLTATAGAVPAVPPRPVPARPTVERPVPPPPAAERPVVKRPVVQSPVGPSTAEFDRRLRTLEDKVDRLLKEVESRRREKQQQ